MDSVWYPHTPLQAAMPISAQQWRVSIGLFNCSRMRWLLKRGGVKKKACPFALQDVVLSVLRMISC